MDIKTLNKKMLYMFSHIYEQQVYQLREKLRGTSDFSKAEKEGSYTFIPQSPTEIAIALMDLKEELEKEKWRKLYSSRVGFGKFLDAGCGIGNIMVLAEFAHICGTVYGLEYYDKTLQAGRKFIAQFGIRKNNLRKADILKYRKYSEYDIIYYYHPFYDRGLEVIFEEKVEDDMKVGAVVLFTMKASRAIFKDKRFRKINIPYIRAFIKVTDGKRISSNTHHIMYPSKEMDKKYKRIIKNSNGKELS